MKKPPVPPSRPLSLARRVALSALHGLPLALAAVVCAGAGPAFLFMGMHPNWCAQGEPSCFQEAERCAPLGCLFFLIVGSVIYYGCHRLLWPGLASSWMSASPQQLRGITDYVSRNPELHPFVCSILKSGRTPVVREYLLCAYFEVDANIFRLRQSAEQERQADTESAMSMLRLRMGDECM